LCGADKVNVRVNAASRQNQPFARNGLRAGAEHKRRCNAIHNIRVAGFSDTADFAVLDADIRFINAGAVNDQNVCNHGIRTFPIGHTARLSHAVTQGFSSAEFGFIAVNGKVLFHLDNQRSIRKPDPIACGRAEHIHILFF